MTIDVHVTHHVAVDTAGVRRAVPMDALTDFFAEAFTETMRVLEMQGIPPVGPPFGKYYGMPGATVDVEAGFPVAAAIASSGEVVPGRLPDSRVVEAEHVGSYDTLEETYAEMQRFMAGEGLTGGDVMWESYLNGPATEPDPTQWRTVISIPLADQETTATPDSAATP
ncbi:MULTISPECIES: GyrI-like domain-containing protein [Microbacterium]|uniref:GyrI-like domain-containing protein n=1 Tax=Microbacterium TaxID=33882 RepID=UPI00146D5D3C|nr:MULTISPECIES: GyrI-like domain-containing protein [Microbacterium]